jgi:hypothetical protein
MRRTDQEQLMLGWVKLCGQARTVKSQPRILLQVAANHVGLGTPTREQKMSMVL